MANSRDDIVVVDDNPVLAGTLSDIFTESGYTVRTASDGFEALALLRKRVPDVLLSDLNMPRMSGFELLSIVRMRYPSVAVVAMSGAYSDRAIPLGVAADGFYAKGSGGAARLFEILDAVRDEATRQCARAAAPIWISGGPIDHDGLATFSIPCPECLRIFPHVLHDVTSLPTEQHCPHCHHPVEFAIVEPSFDIDRTGLGMPVETSRSDAPSYAH